MARKRRPHVRKSCTDIAVTSLKDPELEAILERTENKATDHPVEVESNQQLEAGEVGTPVSVYVGCLVPSPTLDSSVRETPPLCRRSPRAVERYYKSRERFMRRVHKIKRRTKVAVETITRSRAALDIRRIYSAMRRATDKLEPFSIKRLFEHESE